MADRTGILVKILGDSSGLKKATDEATSMTDKFSNVLKGVGVGIGMAGFNLATDMVSNFVGSLGAAGEAYRQDQVSQQMLATALKNNVAAFDGSTAAVEKYAAAQARLGFEDEDVRQSIAQLVGITHDETRAMQLNSLAQDLARSKGIDLAQATDIVTKAAQGNGKALKSLGVDIGDAKDAAGMLDAIQKNVTGSAEKWADTSAGKLAVANVKQSEAWEKIGGIVDKFTTAVLPIAADAFSAFADVLDQVAVEAGPIIDAIGKELPGAMTTAGRMLAELGQIFSDVWHGIEPIVRAVTQSIIEHLQSVVRIFQGIIDMISGALSGDWGKVWTGLQNVVGGAMDNIGSTIRLAFGGIIDFIWGVPGKIASAAVGMFDGIWQAFRKTINAVIWGWNQLNFTVPSFSAFGVTIGGFKLGVPGIPYLHSGGIVPGVPGADVLAMLQAGERVLPAGSAGVTYVFNIQNAYGNGQAMDQLTREIVSRLRLAGVR